jgi:hypothetical protein
MMFDIVLCMKMKCRGQFLDLRQTIGSGWMKLQHNEVHSLYFLYNICRMIKSSSLDGLDM